MFIRILILLVLVSTSTFSQSLYVFDNMESTSGFRGMSSMINSQYIGLLSNAVDNPPNYPMYASSDSCYMIKGIGLGSSTAEVDTFTYPNLSVIPGRTYEIRFKVASFGINPSVNTAAGVDGSTDTLEFQYRLAASTWFRDCRIIGNSNAIWSFDGAIGTNANLSISRNANTVPNLYVSNAGNPITNVAVRLNPGTYSTIQIRFISKVNGSGETWMLDDVEIWDLSSTLPVELIEFNGKYFNTGLKLYWSTASEINNDYFEILKSYDSFNFFKIASVRGKGNSNSLVEYEYIDYEVCDTIVYYKLKQVDYDGTIKEYGPIAFRCRQAHIYDDFYDILGRKVKQDYDGIKIYQK